VSARAVVIARVARLALLASAAACAAAGCKANTVNTDAYSYPDLGPAGDDAGDVGVADVGVTDVGVADVGVVSDAADAGAPPADTGGDAASALCDLLLQNCPDGQSCYPDQPGTARCAPPGSGPPLSICATGTECDARQVCVYVVEAEVNMCAPICDPAAAPTGCAQGSTCRLIPGYQAGFCTP